MEHNGNRRDIGDQLRHAIAQAVESKDFNQINKLVGDTVNAALEEARQQFIGYRDRQGGGDCQAGQDFREAPGCPGPRESGANQGCPGTREPGVNQSRPWSRESGANQSRPDPREFEAGRNRPDPRESEVNQKHPEGRSIPEPQGWQSMDTPGASSPPPRELPAIRVNWRGKVSAILYIVFGSIGSGVFGITMLSFLLVALLEDGPVWWALGLFFGLLTAGFGFMLCSGISRQGRISRLKGYIKELKNYGRPYCETSRLAHASGRSLSFIQKDLRKIIGLGMLPDAHMDDGATCVMLDEETYDQYRRSKEAFLLREQEQKREETAKAEETRQEETPVDAAVRRGQEYMDTLDRLRESMPGSPVYGKLIRLDVILERLFEALRKYPSQLDELEKFMEYYLPTTVKLVSAYQEFSEVEFQGENLSGARKEIEETLDTINTAFENLLDDFYKDAAFDAVTDASVLQTVLAREGLTDPDFIMDDK